MNKSTRTWYKSRGCFVAHPFGRKQTMWITGLFCRVLSAEWIRMLFPRRHISCASVFVCFLCSRCVSNLWLFFFFFNNAPVILITVKRREVVQSVPLCYKTCTLLFRPVQLYVYLLSCRLTQRIVQITPPPPNLRMRRKGQYRTTECSVSGSLWDVPCYPCVWTQCVAT